MTDLFSQGGVSLAGDAPPTFELRPYQSAAVDSALNWLRYKNTPAIISLPTGAGKTHCVNALAERFHEEGQHTLLLAHRKELLEQAGKVLTPPFGYYSASIGEKRLDQPVTVANIQSIYNVETPPYSRIIIDECFAGNTLIDTPLGTKRIDKIRAGDIVYNAAGHGKVLGIFCANKSQTITLRLSNGKAIECTRDHPFFTESGWKEAGELAIGEVLFRKEEMSAMWGELQPEPDNERWATESAKRSVMEQKNMLLTILLQEIQEPDAQFHDSQKGKQNTKGYMPYSKNQRGKRSAIAIGAISYAIRFRRWLANRVTNQDLCGASKWRISKLLQSGYRKSPRKDCNRNRWDITYDAKSEGSRRKENGIPETIRVESVSCNEYSSPISVYNLRVSRHPSYFANGILVHNCHRVPNSEEGQYWTLLKKHPDAKIVGLTATPFRLNGGALQWGEVVYNIGYKELRDAGYLCSLTNKVPSTPDLSTVNVTAGDFSQDELEYVMSDGKLIMDAVRHILAYSEDRNSVLIFCVSIKHCNLLGAVMEQNGIGGLIVSGETPIKERDAIVEDFKAGKIRYLLNCEILLEGFDSPNIDMIVCLRPTMSHSLWEQLIGRGVRKHPDKTNCLLIDLSGNLRQHGGLGTPHREKAKGEKRRELGRVCPECETWIQGSNISQCTDCNYEFPASEEPKVTHNANADTKSKVIYEGNIESYKVRGVHYAEHRSKKKDTISLRVDYLCDFDRYGKISEWLSPHHESEWVRHKAYQFFKDRGWEPWGGVDKYSMDDLLFHAVDLKQPVEIVVDHAGEFPRIKRYIWGEREQPAEEQLDLLDGDTILF